MFMIKDRDDGRQVRHFVGSPEVQKQYQIDGWKFEDKIVQRKADEDAVEAKAAIKEAEAKKKADEAKLAAARRQAGNKEGDQS